MWFTLALASAALAAVRRVGEKRLLASLDQFTLGWLVQATSLPLLVVIMLIAGQVLNPLTLGTKFWWPFLIGTVFFYPVNTWLFYGALKHGELSKVLPVQSIMPALSLLLSFLILGELPAPAAFFGIGFIVVGLYILNMSGLRLHNPIRPFVESKASLYMLGSTTAVALIAPVDKLAVQASNPTFYAVASTIVGAVLLYVIAKIRKKPGQTNLKPILGSAISIGIIQGLSFVTFVGALAFGPASYIVAVKSSSALMGAALGIIYLREPLTRAKSISFALILAGLALVAFGI